MKRSEMIQEMASAMILRLIDYKIDLDFGKAQELATEILLMQENKGMVPEDRGYGDEPDHRWDLEDAKYNCESCGQEHLLTSGSAEAHYFSCDNKECANKFTGYKDDWRGYKIENGWIVRK
jgi:hypothetical protein